MEFLAKFITETTQTLLMMMTLSTEILTFVCVADVSMRLLSGVITMKRAAIKPDTRTQLLVQSRQGSWRPITTAIT